MAGLDPLRTAVGWKLKLSPHAPGEAASVGALGGLASLAASLSPVPLGDEITLGHGHFRADISVSRGIGLDGGRVKIVIERVPFRTLQTILGAYESAAREKTEGGGLGAYYGSLSLLWRIPAPYPGLDEAADLLQSALGMEDGDLVADFVVTGLSTDVDRVNYRLTIDGVDSAWFALATRRVAKPTTLASAKDVSALCEALKVPRKPSGQGGGALGALAGAVADGVGGAAAAALAGGGGAGAGGEAPATGTVVVTPRDRVLDRLGEIQATIAQQAKAEWLGGFLLDNGHLLVGADVKEAFDAEPLDLASQVISARPHARDITEPSASEQVFVLEVRGNAAVKPGRVVAIRYAEPSARSASTGLGYADAAIGAVTDPLGLGGGGGKPVKVYVRHVRHRLAPSVGFVTEIDGVKVGDDKATLPAKPQREAPLPASRSPDASAGLITAAIARRERDTVDVGELRAFRAVSSGDASPAQTGDLIVGLAAGSGEVQPYRTLDVQREQPSRAHAVPYVTPFAWGPYGLVLPRYPGMRLALARPQGKVDQAIDLGALWWSGEERNTDAGPSKAQVGDYWLILPVDPDVKDAPDDDPATALRASAASSCHDLIDRKGRRFLQLRELTLRVGDWVLKAPSERPADSKAEGGLRIEGKDGTAVIEIDKDGNLRIQTPQTLTIKADKGVTIESSGGVTLKSDNVDVSVKSGKMDVT